MHAEAYTGRNSTRGDVVIVSYLSQSLVPESPWSMPLTRCSARLSPPEGATRAVQHLQMRWVEPWAWSVRQEHRQQLPPQTVGHSAVSQSVWMALNIQSRKIE